LQKVLFEVVRNLGKKEPVPICLLCLSMTLMVIAVLEGYKNREKAAWLGCLLASPGVALPKRIFGKWRFCQPPLA